MKKIFLHGLDSSGDGTKGRFFKDNFPEVVVPNFYGSLEERLQKLETICNITPGDKQRFVLVGSSFGGLMAACFAVKYPGNIGGLVLMAPALNFPGLELPKEKITAHTYLLIGSGDDVTPAEKVLPVARQTFANLEINLVDEDHLLHHSFPTLDWKKLLGSDLP